MNGRRTFLHALIVLGIVAGIAMGPTRAMALDSGDVENLLRNHVAEDVILNMVEDEDSLYITTEEANVLRSLGASENLIAALHPTDITTTYAEPDIAAFAATVESTESMPAAGTPIAPVAITMSSAFPPRYDKEGWLTIMNRDWQPYYVNIAVQNKRIFISRSPNGGFALQSGQSITVNIRKEGYKAYGDTGKSLTVKVREAETTTLSLNPFGVFGNSGLTGVATDREKVRTEVLFSNYVPAPTVIVQEPPVVVVPGPPVYYAPTPRYYYGPRGYYHHGRRW
jgi:hypothetical protein